MEINRAAFGALAVFGIVAAGGGAYLANRHNDVPTESARLYPAPVASAVTETENSIATPAVAVQPAPFVAEEPAPAPSRPSSVARRAPARVPATPPASQRTRTNSDANASTSSPTHTPSAAPVDSPVSAARMIQQGGRSPNGLSRCYGWPEMSLSRCTVSTLPSFGVIASRSSSRPRDCRAR